MVNVVNEKVEAMMIWHVFKCNVLLWLEHISIEMKNNGNNHIVALT